MEPTAELTDAALWEAFHLQQLPSKDWTHRCHLRMAWLYLKRHPLDEAHILLRVGIIKLNASHGLVETPLRGYHETITRAFLALVADRMRGLADLDDSARFVTAASLPSDALLRHYTKERVLSLEARARFVPPDLEPLPA
jgi:hypothetical protein